MYSCQPFSQKSPLSVPRCRSCTDFPLDYVILLVLNILFLSRYAVPLQHLLIWERNTFTMAVAYSIVHRHLKPHPSHRLPLVFFQFFQIDCPFRLFFLSLDLFHATKTSKNRTGTPISRHHLPSGLQHRLPPT